MISVKQMKVEDWEQFRDIRLFSLQESPHAYGSSYADAVNLSESEWKNYLGQKDKAIFGLFDHKKIMGLGSVRVLDDTKEHAGLFMGYVAPDYRGRGLSKLLYEARIEWARAHPSVSAVITFNKASNIAAQAMNKGFGFKLISRKPRDNWPDGSTDDALKFKLNLS